MSKEENFERAAVERIFAERKDFVIIGNLTLLPQCREVYPAMEKLYGVHFRIPKYSEFCTAIGAALYYTQKR